MSRYLILLALVLATILGCAPTTKITRPQMAQVTEGFMIHVEPYKDGTRTTGFESGGKVPLVSLTPEPIRLEVWVHNPGNYSDVKMLEDSDADGSVDVAEHWTMEGTNMVYQRRLARGIEHENFWQEEYNTAILATIEYFSTQPVARGKEPPVSAPKKSQPRPSRPQR